MQRFEQLVSTPPEQQALERLRSATGTEFGAMERHCLRVRHIATELGARRGWVLDGSVLTIAALLHDIGLYPAVSEGGVYTAEGARLARELVLAAGWSQGRTRLVEIAIDHHHELRSQLGLGPEVEALRLADLIDLTAAVWSAGIERAWIAQLTREVPRSGFYAELARELGRALRERPLTLLQIFWRPDP